MNKILKIFPFMPTKDNAGKLILAFLLYYFVPNIIISPIAGLLICTIILMPVGMLLTYAASIYQIVGLILVVLNYLGKEIDLEKKN